MKLSSASIAAIENLDQFHWTEEPPHRDIFLSPCTTELCAHIFNLWFGRSYADILEELTKGEYGERTKGDGKFTGKSAYNLSYKPCCFENQSG